MPINLALNGAGHADTHDVAQACYGVSDRAQYMAALLVEGAQVGSLDLIKMCEGYCQLVGEASATYRPKKSEGCRLHRLLGVVD
ncbi:hypothetical protein ACFOHJ_05390 [Aquamicrobium soli]|uniref:Uncharacterized protein n=1 Tax=Aquamicrobium soli TaxID=1811518 RepID=A0ABV7K5M1_9HYPH